MAELLDIVDDQDRVIGQMERGLAHAYRKRHRSVHVIIHHQGKVLLQLRGPKQKANPGLWDSSVAGHVEAGKGYDETAVREAKEEMGLNLSKLKALGKLKPNGATGWEYRSYYLVDCDQKPRPSKDEVSSIRWLRFAELDCDIKQNPQIYTLAFREIWALLCSARLIRID